VEAAIKSGSLITAKYALEQSREVFAVPGSVYNINSSGCHQLIKQGAKLTEQVSDINEEFPNIVQLVQKSETKKPEKKQDLPLATDKLLASVGFEATSIDVVAQRSGLPVTVVMSELLEYELRGLVAPVPGGYIRLGE
jgi:DNA processing protein